MKSQKLAPYDQTRWGLEDLFPGEDGLTIDTAFTTLEEKAIAFESLREALSPGLSHDEFFEIIHRLEEIERLAYRIYGYANLLFTEDTQNQAAQTLMARVDQSMAGISNRIMFFTLWWKGLKDEDALHLMENTGDYHYWLEEMRHFTKHTLSEPEEKVINFKNVTGSSAFTLLYNAITNRYTFHLDVEGQPKELTRGELMVYARHHDAALREAAYKELMRVYKADGPILGQIYQALARDWRNEQVELRRFETPISARNLANDVPDDVVDTLLDVCSKNAGVFQRFFALKARKLGMERLRRCDIYAPIAKSDRLFSFPQAVDLTMDSFTRFDPKLAEMAQRVFVQKHIDSEVRKGKQGGAFCLTTLPELTPWVQLNYQGRAEDVATMAHELGHAVHSMLASRHSLFTYHASLPLAETASTFGEMLLVDRLLQEETDEAVRRDLLFRQVDDAYATIQRQAFFAIFERQAHEMVNQNASADEMSQAYLENLRIQFGQGVDVDDSFAWEWVAIPHIFHTPFYVYAYTFGQLLVLSLYAQYKAEGESFKPRYLKILSAGGSKSPADILAGAGIDIQKASFWQCGFDVIARLVDQLEGL